mmetsp:Transcript_132224/g.329748  ORF Transcript_132224/g.329748 Transcript_132224/m.329748 type:complete len:409 (-) Transcript_132224:167-1393(-)
MALVEEQRRGRVLHLHINSPDNLNALSGAMIREIYEKFAPERVRSASVVMLTSAGRHFGAGHDLAEMASGCYEPTLFRQCSNLMQRVAECEIPVVAAVQGCAFAAGCQLAASCDIVLAASSARFATPGVKIGLFCSTPSVAVTRAATAKVAAEMLYAGRELTATEALHAGLISRIIDESDAGALQAEALRTCQRIAETPRELLVAGKALVMGQKGKELGQAYAMASEAMEHGMARSCATEGIGAFLEKRPPQWGAEEYEVAEAVSLVSQGVAVVGASPDPSRPSHGVFRAIQRAGPAYPVNPQASAVAGVPTSATLAAVQAPFAVVDIFRASGSAAAEAVDEAIALAKQGCGVRAIWLQEGIRAPEAEARARAAGLICVADRCLSVELRRRGSTNDSHGRKDAPRGKL